jgi:hypothetical protein
MLFRTRRDRVTSGTRSMRKASVRTVPTPEETSGIHTHLATMPDPRQRQERCCGVVPGARSWVFATLDGQQPGLVIAQRPVLDQLTCGSNRPGTPGGHGAGREVGPGDISLLPLVSGPTTGNPDGYGVHSRQLLTAAPGHSRRASRSVSPPGFTRDLRLQRQGTPALSGPERRPAHGPGPSTGATGRVQRRRGCQGQP